MFYQIQIQILILKVWNDIKDWICHTYETHSIKKILEVFDSNTGQVGINENIELKIREVEDWPFCTLR